MDKIFFIITLIFLSSFELGSSTPTCPPNKCVGPNIALNATNCNCYCIEEYACKSYQIFNKVSCQCRCIQKPKFTCPPNQVWSEAICDCTCPSVNNCTSRQVPIMPTCACGCADAGAKNFCNSIQNLNGNQYEFSDANCSCYSKFGDQVNNLPFGVGSALIAATNGSINYSDPIQAANGVLNILKGLPNSPIADAANALSSVMTSAMSAANGIIADPNAALNMATVAAAPYIQAMADSLTTFAAFIPPGMTLPDLGSFLGSFSLADLTAMFTSFLPS